MKYIITLFIVSLFFVSCINCNMPPKVAYKHTTGDKGMEYHFTIYSPDASGPYFSTGITNCPEYSYFPINLYTDNLGLVELDTIVWTNVFGGEGLPIDESMRVNVKFNISSSEIIVSGLTGDFTDINGRYKIQDSPPNPNDVYYPTE